MVKSKKNYKENNNNNKSPIKIRNLNNKINKNEIKKEKDASVIISEYSKIIGKREYDAYIYDKDEQLNAPKKNIR